MVFCVCFAPHSPPFSAVQGSVSSSDLLMKIGICNSTWAGLFVQPKLALFFFFLLLAFHGSSGPLSLLKPLCSRGLRFSNRPAMLFDVGWRGFIQVWRVWRPVLPPPSLWCYVHPQPGALALSESPVFQTPTWIEGPLMELIGGAVRFLLSLHAEAGIYSGAGR